MIIAEVCECSEAHRSQCYSGSTAHITKRLGALGWVPYLMDASVLSEQNFCFISIIVSLSTSIWSVADWLLCISVAESLTKRQSLTHSADYPAPLCKFLRLVGRQLLVFLTFDRRMPVSRQRRTPDRSSYWRLMPLSLFSCLVSTTFYKHTYQRYDRQNDSITQWLSNS